ncbi:MAG: hypothetical protein HY706_00145 [Candidatus Hydrogenedentes bacterium]|nr:hypothetical protein [Candidatus Hydrogenedentota bacterium]
MPTCVNIVLWWELRRIPYNLIVGFLGFAGFVLHGFLKGQLGIVYPAGDIDAEMAPMVILFAAPFFINIAYTAGWIVEIFLTIVLRLPLRNAGPRLFKFGLAFSLFVVLAPTAYWGVYFMIHWVAGVVL